MISMTFTTTQKIIKVGSSKGVLLPAKELKRLGVEAEDTVKITVEVQKPAKDPQYELMAEYESFVAEYGQALKSLADR